MDVLWFQHDREFHELFEAGRTRTGMPESRYRPGRFYNLTRTFLATQGLAGAVAEAGCYRGFSSWLLCAAMFAASPVSAVSVVVFQA